MIQEEEILPHESGHTKEQVAQKSCGGSKPGNVQSQFVWGLDQADLGGGVSVCGIRVELKDLEGLFQSKSLHYSIVL